jgi:hypothetical protein
MNVERAPQPSKIADGDRRCMVVLGKSGRGYCGRARKPENLVTIWRRVSCPDCRAAYRADGGKLA